MARRGPARALACALLLALASAASALYDAGGPVISDLTDANYRSKLKGLALLELYAPCACPRARRSRCARRRATQHTEGF